jgi:hypothetical protein
VTATQNADGTIAVTWTPVVASPPLSNYVLKISDPSGQQATVRPSVPAYLVQDVPQIGIWTFSVSAVNALGSSASAATTLKIAGTPPDRPLGLDLTVSETGWFSATWLASRGVPTANTYYLALYGPNATAESAYKVLISVPASDGVGTIRVPHFYQVAKDSAAGPWVAVVTPVNSIGPGPYAAAQVVVSSGLVASSAKAQEGIRLATPVPADLANAARGACLSGKWTFGMAAFGTCSGGSFTPISG